MPLKLRRGTSSNRTSITPAEGEPIYTTDTKKLYIGDGSTAGGVVVDTTGVSDGDKGDITVSSSGATWTIDNDAVTYAKIQNVSATDRLLGRSSAGAGDVEEITCTSAGRALLDDADAAAQRTTLGLGTLATQSGTFSGTSSGTNTGDQNLFSTIAVSGQSNVVADSTTDTLTIASGTGISITTNDTTDTVTIATSGVPTGSGAANKVALWSGSSALTSDTNLHYDSLNDRLSIGLASPSAKIHIESSDNDHIKLDGGGETANIFVGDDGGALYIQTSTFDGIVLDAVGAGVQISPTLYCPTISVSDSAYSSSWNTSTAVPTRNAVYDRVQDVALAAITFIIDGGGSAITTGIKGDLEIPFACTIEEVIVLADQTGSIVVDIWKDTYANFPPTDADSITASATPTLSSAAKSQNDTLTGWTTSITAGDILRFNVDSATTVQRVSIILQVRK